MVRQHLVLDTVSTEKGLAVVAYTAIIIAIIGLSIAGYMFYKASNEISKTNEKLSEISEKLTALNKTQAEQNAKLESYSQLAEAIKNINESLKNVASAQDLVKIAEEITLLKSSINQSQKDLIEQITKLEEKVKSLEDKILFPATIIDGSGDEVLIPSKPERIVSLAPSVTEILYYVNATDRLVGVDSYSDYPEWVAEARNNGSLVDVGGFFNPSVEAILSAQPDLVIGVAGVTAHQQVKQILKAYGIPVILLPQSSLNDIKKSLLIVGRATGNIEEAVKAAMQFESDLSRIKLANYTSTPKVALIVWLNPIWVTGNNTFQSEAIYWAGGVNVFANYTGWGTISAEQLLEASPDIIIGVGVNKTAIISLLEEELGDSANQIPAIANDRVYCIGYPYSDMLNRPSPRIINAIVVLQLIIHPEVYGYTPSTVPSCINSTSLPSVPSVPSVPS